jgi:Ser/Thr protein kinase RdoA (MazF antagonist)
MLVSDSDLRLAISAALGRPIGGIERRPWPYRSSVPMEKLTVVGHGPLLFKDLSPRTRPCRPDFMIDPLREVEAYQSLLAGLDTPALYGAVVQPGRVWLFLELVDGIPLWQAEAPDAWEAAARWLARLHARALPDGSHLLHYDAGYLRRWLERADAIAPAGTVAGLRSPVLRAVERLSCWPRAFVHGEYYPSNVLVHGARIRPVDWETGGIGPGLLDLAALTAGVWEPMRQARIVAAYRDELSALPDDFEAVLDAARLLVAVQWLGWSQTWSPPPEHRHDWAADARTYAARVVA